MSLFDSKEKEKEKEKETKNKGTGLAKQVVSLEKMAADAGIELPSDDFVGSLEPVILRIDIKHSASMFEMPDGTPLKSLKGIIVQYSTPNAWWSKGPEDSDANTIPDCYSFDGIKPDIVVSKPINENCATCDYNQFGSDTNGTGKGKKCKNKVRLFFLPDGENFPFMISLSPTSIKSWAEYVTGLKAKGTRYFATITEITLDRVKKPPYEWSVAKFTNHEIIDHYEDNQQAVIDRIALVFELIKTASKKMTTETITAAEEPSAAGSDEGYHTDPY